MTVHSDGRYFQLQSPALGGATVFSGPRFYDQRTPIAIAENFGVSARVINLMTEEVVATIEEGVSV